MEAPAQDRLLAVSSRANRSSLLERRVEPLDMSGAWRPAFEDYAKAALIRHRLRIPNAADRANVAAMAG